MMHDLKAFRYDSSVTGITQFYLPPTHKPYLPLVPSRKASLPWGGTNLYCLVTEAHRYEKLAQSFYAACPVKTRTRGLLIASPTLYWHHHDATLSTPYFATLYMHVFASLTNSAFLCVDWKPQAVLPRTCTVEVRIVGLHRSHTTWRWQEGS